MGRKRKPRIWPRVLAAAMLLALVGAGWTWWHLRSWKPGESAYPEQGVELAAADGAADFAALKAVGADFAYLDASSGADRRDPAFTANYEAAREAGMAVGAVHGFDPCERADPQSANFVTVVPRDDDMLPAAIALELPEKPCETPVGEAQVESELMTFLNQVETHLDKPVLLKVSPAFEAQHGIAAKLERNLWLVRTRWEPDYAGRPWMLWTATDRFVTQAHETGPLRWVVVRP